MACLILSRPDAGTLCHAVTWLLDVPFSTWRKPALSESERHKLTDIYESLIKLLTDNLEEVYLDTDGELRVDQAKIYVSLHEFKLLHEALVAFRGELSEIRNEIQIITGRPPQFLSALIDRFSNALEKTST